MNHEKVTLTDFVFLNENGNPYEYHGINKALKRIIKAYNKQECEKAEAENRDPVLIDPIGSHIFRHTYSTRMAEMDVNMKVLQSVMGHADIKTTMNIYTDAQPQKIHEEFEKVNQKYKLS